MRPQQYFHFPKAYYTALMVSCCYTTAWFCIQYRHVSHPLPLGLHTCIVTYAALSCQCLSLTMHAQLAWTRDCSSKELGSKSSLYLQLFVVFLPDQGILKCCTIKVGSVKLGTSDDCIGKFSAREVGICEVNPIQYCIGEVSTCIQCKCVCLSNSCLYRTSSYDNN